MNEKNQVKINNIKKIVLPIIGVFLLLLTVISVSYAFFVYNGKGTTDNTVTAGTITFSYSDATVVGNGIKLENQMPISDADGKALSGDNNVFNFSVTANTTAAAVNYEIVAEKQISSTLRDINAKLYLTDVTGEEIPLTVTNEDGKLPKYSELIDTELKDKIGKTLYKEVIAKGNANYKKDFRLRMWVAEDTDMSDPLNHNKTFSIKVNVYANVGVKEEARELLKDAVIKNLGTTGTVYDASDGFKYIRGESNVVNNYVSYSGMMWRIYRINPDGSVRVILDNTVPKIKFGANNTYETSDIKIWLNSDFWDRLNFSKTTVLKQDNEFCIDSATVGGSARETCTNKLTNQKIGLLTLDEYNIVSERLGGSYLNGYGTNWTYWTMTPSRTWYNEVYAVETSTFETYADSTHAAKPVIIFENATTISSGDGSTVSPYKINGDVVIETKVAK